MSKEQINFKNKFLYRTEVINTEYLTYFNNDIQYGAKYIFKRLMDITLSIILLFVFLPIIVIIILYIYFLDSSPVIVKQKRVGLHGKVFSMYKFRTMKKDSHELRKELSNLNKNKGPLVKIENDPRIIDGALVYENIV